MISVRLLFYLLVVVIAFVIGVNALLIYFKQRSKHNLATFIVMVIIFTGAILSYLFPGPLIPNAGTTIQILLGAILVFFVAIFFFYPDIKRLYYRWKEKNW